MQATEQNTPTSLEDAIAASLDEIDGADDAGTEVADDRPRDEQGRFTKAESAPDTEVAPAETETTEAQATEVTTDQGVETEIKAEPVPPIDPPASWSAAAKAEWQNLPRLLQEEVMKREGDVAKGFEQNAARVKAAETIVGALEPVRATLEANGLDAGTYIGRLVGYDRYLQQDPNAAIRELARVFGADLSAVAGEAAATEPTDPTIAALTQRVDGLTRYLQTDAQTRQQAQQSRIVGEISAFREARDGAGNLKHPHFAEVEDDMAALISAGRATDMAQAYDMAIFANPTIRAQLLEAQNTKAEEVRRVEAAKKAAEAKRIAQTNIQGSTATGATPPATLEESIGQAIDELSAA